MDLLLNDKNKIVNVVNNLKKYKPEGGSNFFDRIDEFIRDSKNIDIIKHLIYKIKEEQGSNFNLIVSGKFGDWIITLIKKSRIKINGVVILVSGSLRSSIKDKSFQVIYGSEDRIYNNYFVLLDDSYYSGSTKKEIEKHLNQYNAKILKTYVVYDGSFTKKDDVFSVYRYYDYHSEDSLPIKKLLGVLNSVDEPNIPYDILENKIMSGQIRSIKELLREIQILKQKFQQHGIGNVNISSYGYKREYEKKNIPNYKEFLNENIEKEYEIGDVLICEKPISFVKIRDKIKITGIYTHENPGKFVEINVSNIYEIQTSQKNPRGYFIQLNVSKSILDEGFIKIGKSKQVFSEEDPYGEEEWEELKESKSDIGRKVKGIGVRFGVQAYYGGGDGYGRIINYEPTNSDLKYEIKWNNGRSEWYEWKVDFDFVDEEENAILKTKWYKKGKLEEKNKQGYYTFEDLKFEPHHLFNGISPISGKPLLHAKMKFDNGGNISVVCGDIFYSNGIDTYEIRSSLDDDIKGYLTKDQVTAEMLRFQRKYKTIITKEDPYGEEQWEIDDIEINEQVENENNGITISAEDFYLEYENRGRKSMRNFLKGKEIEFHSKYKVKVYKGNIIGLLPGLFTKTNEKKIFFDTKEYGTLEVDQNFPIIIR